MAEISLIVMIALFVIAAIIAFKVAKGVLQGVLVVSAIASVILAVAAVVVVKDAIDFQHNFQSGGKLLVFSADNGTVLTSGLLIKVNVSMRPLSGTEIGQLSSAFGRKDYAAMKGDNFKLVIVNEEPLLASMPEELDFEGGNTAVSAEMALLQLRDTGSVEQRARLLFALFAMRSGRNPLFLISGYKKGDITIYPETAVFKAVRILPESLFRKVSEKLLGIGLEQGAMDKVLLPAA